jgi:hypothetical protein
MKLFILLCLYLLVYSDGLGQNTDTLSLSDSCETKDATDYVRNWFNIKPKKKEKTSSIFLAPIIGSTPSTGFVFGVTLQGAFQLPGSKISAFQSVISYTTKQQFTVSLKNNVFASNNKLFLSGDWSYFDNSQPTYGLSTKTYNDLLSRFFNYNDVGAPEDSLVEPMRFKYLKLHQTISFAVRPNWFIGPGIHLDLYTDIDDIKLDTPSRYTRHYIHSKVHGFNPKKYNVIGLSLNIVYDSRDNMINAYKGIYANINYRYNPTLLGSDQMSSTLWTEFRTYIGISKKKPENVLAFWALGHFSLDGTIPYLNLPAIGNDQRNKTGRGYTIARFRGDNLVYGEIEYRFLLSKCTKTLGAVIFLNAVTADSKDIRVELFEYVQPGFGVGIRLLFQKNNRMNIQADYGVGNKSGGIYFGAGEVF